jgi:isopentenyl phosphate kinase
MDELIFLKLGGSLITDKTRPYTCRRDRLAALMEEIRGALTQLPGLRLLIGHGSGSFGHFAVQEYLAGLPGPYDGNRQQSEREAYWRGYAEVRFRAAELNRYVTDALHDARIPAISLQPSAMVKSRNGEIRSWDLASVRAALESTLVPVVYGDIVFDTVLGSKVLSTEALMLHLAPHLRPRRILLAGIEAAVWADYPARHQPIERITPGSYERIAGVLGGSHGTDVTGGMKAKVQEMLELIRKMPGLTVQIFSGEDAGSLRRALSGEAIGTRILSD